jgi:hypothetical protein
VRSFAATLAIALALAGIARAAPADDAEARYQSLLAAAKASAPNADWAALRQAYAARPGFNVFGAGSAKRQMFLALEKGDCATALPEAQKALDAAYIDIDAHFVAAFCEDAAGQGDAAKLDRDIGAGLAASIRTGDGLTPATAFTPIDVDEEYALMRVMNLKVTEQALVRDGAHSYDLLSTVSASGAPGRYYFLIDSVLAAEAAALKPGAISEGGPPERTP